MAYYFIDSVNVICTTCFDNIATTSPLINSIVYDNNSRTLFINSGNSHSVIQITDILGRVVKHIKMEGGGKAILADLPEGLYLSTLQSGGKIITQKMVVN